MGHLWRHRPARTVELTTPGRHCGPQRRRLWLEHDPGLIRCQHLNGLRLGIDDGSNPIYLLVQYVAADAHPIERVLALGGVCLVLPT